MWVGSCEADERRLYTGQFSGAERWSCWSWQSREKAVNSVFRSGWLTCDSRPHTQTYKDFQRRPSVLPQSSCFGSAKPPVLFSSALLLTLSALDAGLKRKDLIKINLSWNQALAYEHLVAHLQLNLCRSIIW